MVRLGGSLYSPIHNDTYAGHVISFLGRVVKMEVSALTSVEYLEGTASHDCIRFYVASSMDHINGAPHRLDFLNGAVLGCALSLVVSTLTGGVLRHRHTIEDGNDDGSESSEEVA